jgi:hypothetical protein
MIDELGCGSGPVVLLMHYPSICLEELSLTMKYLRIVDLQVENETMDHLNIKEYQPLDHSFW